MKVKKEHLLKIVFSEETRKIFTTGSKEKVQNRHSYKTLHERAIGGKIDFCHVGKGGWTGLNLHVYG